MEWRPEGPKRRRIVAGLIGHGSHNQFVFHDKTVPGQPTIGALPAFHPEDRSNGIIVPETTGNTDTGRSSGKDIIDIDHYENDEPAPVLELEKNEIEMIRKALEKYKSRRKEAARELGISERTLYRKIKQYGL